HPPDHNLSKHTQAHCLASATPHNGKKEPSPELIRLLEPTAVKPDGNLDEEAVKKLIVRRHRYSEDVKKEVGADWAERKEPQARIAQASLEENAVAEELDQIWLHPTGHSPYSGKTNLFPCARPTASLSTPEALLQTIDNRLRVLETHEANDAVARERSYLDRLRGYAADSLRAVERNRAEKRQQTGKYGALLDYLKEIGI